jgi:response regulator RpfG family c-di-GMP phosphodiesterase
MTPPAKKCLLVVDDESDVCDSIHDLLRRDYRVLKARSAADGYRLMQENEVHIIMTDQRMPQISGVEMLAKVRVGHPQAVRMLFTGYADLEAIIAAINQGHIFKFVKKPWQPEDLQAAILEAATEYDRLVQQAEEKTRLQSQLQNLRDRVTTLEGEVDRLRENSGGRRPSD